MSRLYTSPDFEAEYTYHGDDLGATWSAEKTCFRLWAPTADTVNVKLYRGGDASKADILTQFPMKRDIQGTWYAQYTGNLNGVYYTYLVTHGENTIEACDPYARTTGVNGMRAMVIDLSSTNPNGWETDVDPHAGLSVTDAVIYELHVRDLSIDKSSGIKHKGKYLGLIEEGTTTASGIATGLDHIKELGITHLHLLPVYDYGSVDERDLNKAQFNWGYDPVNFNVPEGSYSTDPYNGAVRVREMKEMIKGLHDNGISVIMDVVYNHVYDAKGFCFNQIVPDYFSRTKNGAYSNGSGCGNDTASERSMVRKYIVDSVCYWADEYHFDGFRFDLVGLLDTITINEIVRQVHKKHPNVIFYGEGWDIPTDLTKNCDLAIQKNSKMTPGFAYFNDTIRDGLRGSIFLSDGLGFVTGAADVTEDLKCCFKGLPVWCSDPKQTVNYASCHDNNTLIDRISLAAKEHSFEEQVRMNNLAAAFYMMSQGIPFLHAGEEMLRSKPDGKGGVVENSYNASDAVNSIKWKLLEKQIYRETFEYYKGLIAFRKAHPVLRLTTAYDVLSHVVAVTCDNPHLCAFQLTGNIPDEPAEELFMIFNASEVTENVDLPAGTWQICIDGEHAGTEVISTVQKCVSVAPISALILMKRK